MDLSRIPRRRYTPFVTPLEFLPNFSRALAQSCPGGQGPNIWIKRDDMLGLFPGGIRRGGSGFDICFVHPKGSAELPVGGEGVLIELVQAPPEVVKAFAALAAQ